MTALPALHAGAIDIHAHTYVAEVFEAVKDYSLTYLPMDGAHIPEEVKQGNRDRQRRVFDMMTDVTQRVTHMDNMGVGAQALTCSQVHQCTYWMAPEDSLRYERIANDRMAAIVRGNPTRFRGFGNVPLQSPKLAVQEAERCIGELGLTGIQIGTFVAGREVGDKELFPFWAKIEELGACVYIHPCGSRDPRFKKHAQWNSIGQCFEEAMAIASLMYEGVVDKYPKLRICISHGGGYMPFNMGRINRNWIEKPVTRLSMKQAPDDFLKLLWFDSCTYDATLLQHLVAKVGADRVVLGSDYPIGDRKPLEFVKSCGFDAASEARILRGNAETFLGL